MTTVTIITLLISIYVLSIVSTYLLLRWLYQTKWVLINPSFSDVLVVFMPVLNSIATVAITFEALAPDNFVGRIKKLNKKSEGFYIRLFRL